MKKEWIALLREVWGFFGTIIALGLLLTVVFLLHEDRGEAMIYLILAVVFANGISLWSLQTSVRELREYLKKGEKVGDVKRNS